MTYLLFLTFTLSTAVIPFTTKESCEKEAEYYHIHYGEELTKAECLTVGDLE
jgi:hypothetical protein